MRYYSYILFIFLLPSCHHSKDDFLKEVEPIQGKILNMDCLIGMPHSITCMDSLLFFYDRYEKKLVTIFDVKNNKFIGRIISEGKGPEEVVPGLRGLYAFQGKLSGLEAQTGTMVTFNVADTITLADKVKFELRSLEFKKMQNYYVGAGVIGGNEGESRFFVYDLSGHLTRSVGEYPFNQGKTVDGLAYLYQGQLCAYPGKNFFAFGTLLCDNLEFYEVKDDQCKLLRKYETFDIKAQWNNHRIDYTDDSIINYTSSYGTEKYCYMLFSGKTFKDNGGPVLGHYIVAFDWNGNYRKTYGLDVPITSFCVDENTQSLYATVYHEDEFTIRQFKLN